MTDEEFRKFEEKYKGYWMIKDKYEKLKYHFNFLKNSYILRNDSYTEGYRDALKKIEEGIKKIDKGDL